eukprot:gene31696-6900_t
MVPAGRMHARMFNHTGSGPNRSNRRGPYYHMCMPTLAPLGNARSTSRLATQSRAVAGASSAPAKAPKGEDRSHTTEVVVIGSGLGGLSCAGILAKYGFNVTVVESHTQAGGAAHTFKRQGYHFESGPSLHSGTWAWRVHVERPSWGGVSVVLVMVMVNNGGCTQRDPLGGA